MNFGEKIAIVLVHGVKNPQRHIYSRKLLMQPLSVQNATNTMFFRRVWSGRNLVRVLCTTSVHLNSLTGSVDLSTNKQEGLAVYPAIMNETLYMSAFRLPFTS